MALHVVLLLRASSESGQKEVSVGGAAPPGCPSLGSLPKQIVWLTSNGRQTLPGRDG